MGGSSSQNQPGVYGTLGVAAATNMPGGRTSAVAWTDSKGNFWLFGGSSSGTAGDYLNDLWEFNPSSGQWTWMSGSSTNSGLFGSPGVYGTLGQPAVTNVPGGRYGSVGWTDSKGNPWLFGGWGCDTRDPNGGFDLCYYNDLWQFNPSSNQWMWMGGSNTYDQPGVYGTLGTPATSNIPGARENAVSWTDGKGNFWLFGGFGYDSNGTLCFLNDLWQFNPAVGSWDWMSGSSTAPNPFQLGGCQNTGKAGVYGSLGTPANGNSPGSRANAVGWTDSNGNLWMFGGYGADSTGAMGYLNDLWKFGPATNEWTWMGGSSTLGGFGGLAGIYNAWMAPANGSYPGSRQAATTWTDASGNLWLFGGFGYDSTGTYGYLNDLWEFSPSTGEWAWMGGSSTVSLLANAPALYGTFQTPGILNTPGGRFGAVGWTDANGNLWVFGGYATPYPGTYAQPGTVPGEQPGYLNDLWKYQPNSGGQQTAAMPSFSLAAGTYPAGETLTISDATPSATIYYFTGGSASAMQYTGPLTIASTTTIFAMATASGYADSAVASATYTVPITSGPTFSVAPGTYAVTQTVALSSPTPGATIYYAVNSAPTSNSNAYSAPITVSSSEILEAFAVAPGYAPSTTAIAQYTIWPASALNHWAWMGGANTNQVVMKGVYGTRGAPSAENLPGARTLSATWTDGSGSFWLFGGLGIDANGVSGFMNDLWKFDPGTMEWTWMGGSQAVGSPFLCRNSGCGEPGVYGTLGTPALEDIPGGREGPASWTDATGNFWLFGGYGYDSAGNCAFLNDMWKYNPSANEWTWMGGPSEVTGVGYCGGEAGVYGTLGTPSVANIPGGRYQASTWMDGQGNLWLFGGYRFDATNNSEYDFNDLWKFSPPANEWTWMGGNNSPQGGSCVPDPTLAIPICGWAGKYGTLGSPSQSNMPGSRYGATNWTDQTGNVWLAGGSAFDANGHYSPLNDVWRFSPTTNQWTWTGGSSIAPLCAVSANTGCGTVSTIFGYGGVLGVPAAVNIPTYFLGAGSWTDNSGNFWLFGGADTIYGWGANDLWEFTASAGEWTWMSGITPTGFVTGSVGGTYGSLGTPAAGNTPGSRSGAATWTDNGGHLWFFSGFGVPAFWGDLWEYRPSAPAPVPSFGVIAMPSSGPGGTLSLPAGTSGTATIQIVVADGFNSSVALTASNLPTGITASFSPASITGAGWSQVTVVADLSTASGFVYTFTVNGTSGSTTETATFPLYVTPPPPPNFTLSVSPTSLSVNRGSQGTATLTVTPEYGFNSSVSFTCSGLPTGASCSFNPTTVTPSGAAVTSQLTISTSSQSSALRPDPSPLFPVTALAVGLCLIGWRKRRLRYAPLVMVFAGLVLVPACGGGAGGGGGSGPPPVTYTLTVTATASNAMHTATLSLTVN